MATYRLFGVSVQQIVTALIIIAAVAAILFPVFQKVGGGSHRSCQSNLKQLGLAFVQYTQDADEKYPPGVTALNNGWAGQIYPFIKSTDVYHCPDDPHDGAYISYAENQTLAGQTLGDFGDPKYSVTLYETTTLRCDPTKPERVSATGLTAPQDSVRHDPATFALNYLAADGHVKLLMPGQVSSGLHAVPSKKVIAGECVMTFAIR